MHVHDKGLDEVGAEEEEEAASGRMVGECNVPVTGNTDECER